MISTYASARPGDTIKPQAKKVYIDSSVADVGLTNYAYWFNSFSIRAEAKCQGMGFTPWDSNVEAHRNKLTGTVFAADMASHSFLNLTYLFYCLSGYGSLTTIYANSTWALPSNGISGSQCFYNCRQLVGSNSTAWSSGNTSYTYMRIDKSGQTRYLIAA